MYLSNNHIYTNLYQTTRLFQASKYIPNCRTVLTYLPTTIANITKLPSINLHEPNTEQNHQELQNSNFHNSLDLHSTGNPSEEIKVTTNIN